MKFADILIALFIILIIILIVVPLPTTLLDIFHLLNLALSFTVLFIALYIMEPMEFSIFPSLILFSTLFRLSLNISSSRLILTTGDAGAVINTFGSIVIGGNIFVGVIMYLIIVIVQYIVITKGTERVAEVSARFTLDAMPGKQMAIDADLNSGSISEQQAKAQRLNVQREADFYGSMDGASKYIKGDATSSIIITIINIIGGIIVGLMSGMELKEVVSKYLQLTIGNGVLSQISALLISTASGIMVTRTASGSNVGHDLLRQMSSQPISLLIAGLIILVLGLIPGFPSVLFVIAALFIFLAYASNKHVNPVIEEYESPSEEEEVEKLRKPENVYDLLRVDPIELEFGYGIIPLADINQGGDLLDRVVMTRRQIAMELGMIIPVIRLRDNIQLNPNEYVIKIKGIEVSRGQVMTDKLLIMNSGSAEGEIEGIEAIEPSFGLPAKWIDEDKREQAEVYGYTVVDSPSVIATHLTEVIRKHAYELLGRQDVQNLLDRVKEEQPALVDELVPKTMTLGEVQRVLSNLIREGVSIRDMVSILEALADYGQITKDPDILTEYIRQSLARSITNKFIPDHKAKVLTLDPDLEHTIIESVQQGEHGSYLALDPKKTQNLFTSIKKEEERLAQLGIQPIVLTAPLVRVYFKKLTEQIIPDLVILSYNEIESNVDIQSVGVIRG